MGGFSGRLYSNSIIKSSSSPFISIPFSISSDRNNSLDFIWSQMNWALGGFSNTLEYLCNIYMDITYMLFLFVILSLDDSSEFLKPFVISWLIDERNLMWFAQIRLTCWQAALSHPGTVCRNGTFTINNKKDDILSTCAGFQHNIQTEPWNWVLRCALLIRILSTACLVSVFFVIMNLFGIALHELQIYNFIRKCELVIYTIPNAFFLLTSCSHHNQVAFNVLKGQICLYTFLISYIMYFYSIINQCINVPLYKCCVCHFFLLKSKSYFFLNF